ncbi:PPE family protein [Mycobacterium kansasii]|uniref:PPE family protein n=1 Tax=Mycobacterium kansasii TaxID=1768 RepID=A0A1V3W979_MYCKA|nr:PPE family protein [Mycobacterium kansasii]
MSGDILAGRCIDRDDGAAAPYLAWLSAAAQHAEQTAGRPGCREHVRGRTDGHGAPGDGRRQPDSVGVADRVEPAGPERPAIAATEAEYEQMWAQNVAAMSGYYSNASAVASRLTPWQQLMDGLSTTGAGPAAMAPARRSSWAPRSCSRRRAM